MEKKHKLLGSLIGVGVTLFATVLATRGVAESAFFLTRTSAGNSYSLTLNASNNYKNGTSQSIYTDSGASSITFTYDSASYYGSGHVSLASGGTLKNETQITSINKITPVFTAQSDASLQFRASYNNTNWGEYASLTSEKSYDFSSEESPYYVEFKAVGGTVNITSITLEYSCAPNPNAEGGGEEQVFTKVAETLDNFTGTYLIVNNDDSKAFDGSLTSLDATNNYVSVEINDDQIAYSETLLASAFDINFEESSETTKYYSIKSKSGKYIGNSSNSNGLTANDDLSSGLYNEIIWYGDSDDDLYIESKGGAILRYNSNNDQQRFRYFKSSSYTGQQKINLYQLNGGSGASIPEYCTGLTVTDEKTYYLGECFAEFVDGEGLNVSITNSLSDTPEIIKIDSYDYVIKTQSGAEVNPEDPFVNAGTYNVTVSYGNFEKTYSIVVTEIDDTGISLDKTNATILLGDQLTLEATVEPANATHKDVIWTSSNIDVATVSDGVVSSIAIGETTITASSHSGFEASCVVTVANELPSNMAEAYAAGLALENGQTTSEEYTYTGVITSSRISTSNSYDYFIQADGYGLDLYSKSPIEFKVGSKYTVTSKIKKYANLVESVDITEHTLVSEASIPNAVEITSSNTLSNTNQNILVSLTGVVHNISESFDETQDFSLYLDVGDNDLIQVFFKKNCCGNRDGFIESLEKGDTVSVTNGIRSIHNDSDQVLITSQTILEKGEPIVVPVESVTVDPSSTSVDVGSTVNLTANISPANATNKNVTWTSNNTAHATVDENGVVTGVAAGSATITATTEDGSYTSSCTVTVNNVAVSSVTLNKESATLYVGGNDLSLTASVLPENATDKTVTWTSSKTSIATVNNGIVHPVAEGTTTITATAGGISDTCEITVSTQPVGPTTEHVELGAGSNATACTVNEIDGMKVGTSKAGGDFKVYVPSGATKLYIYVAAWNGVSDLSLNITGATTFPSSISLKADAGISGNSPYTLSGYESTYLHEISLSNITSDTTLTFTTSSAKRCVAWGAYVEMSGGGGSTDVSVTGVSVSPTSKTLSINETQQLTATVAPVDATNQSVTWSSNNTSVATVSDAGLVTAKDTGSATITATTVDGGYTATCAITVQSSTVNVTGVTLSSNAETISVGGSVTLTATVAPANATNKTISWSSSNSNVASVLNGVVTGVAAGSATITVTTQDGNRTATCAITVQSGGGSTSDTITIEDTDAPATYGTATQETVDGYTFAFTNVGNSYTSGWMQCKKSVSNIYNVTAISGLKSITINTGSKSWGGTVYYGTSSEPSTNSVSESGGKYTIPSGNSYFNIVTDGSTGYIESIVIEYSTTPVNPTGISIPSTASVGIGSTTTLDVTYSPADCNTNKGVTWSSNNTAKATVDQNGVVTGVATGTATITARSTYNTSFTASCTVTVTEQAKDKWTILIYMCGADLESGSGGGSGGYATSDLNEIKSVYNQPSDVNVVFETGGAQSWKNNQNSCIDASKLSRFHLSNRSYVSDEKITKANMGLSSTLQSFVSWGMETYPAEKTALILWNHGGGMRGVCYDENYSDDALLASEVASALNGAGCTGDNKLEWIGYDACLMGVQDIAEKNSQYAKYMVASEESEAGSGWDYDTWLDDVFLYKSTTTILKAIVDGFIQDQGGPNSYNGDQTLAYYDLSYAAAYKTAWESFASALSTKFGKNVSKSTFGRWMHNNVKYFGGESDDDEYFGVFDAKDFVNQIASDNSYNPGSTYTNAVLTAHSNFVGYSVAQRGAGNAYGIACTYHYTTSNNWKFNTCYGTNETNFTNWRSFLNSYGTL